MAPAGPSGDRVHADLLRPLQARPRFAANIVAVERQTPRAARHAPWPPDLADALIAAAGHLGIDRPYTHQAEAMSRLLSGEDVIVSSGTASGKSLCYVLPVLDRALRDPAARALFLFPTKALAQDQLASLRTWSDALPEHDVAAATYDGDTPASARPGIRRGARIVLTNPDMLHAGILPRHQQWSELFRGLSHVVIDEAHVYRGVFGSHVANVIRRLRRVAAFHGAHPRFVLTSATIRNPVDLAGRLVGRGVRLVDSDGSPGGGRTLVLYNPPIVDEQLGIRRSSLAEADALARHFLALGLQTIVFAQTRQAVELVVRSVADGLAAGGDAAGGPRVRGYRGGYTATERRAIEAELRDGRLQCVVATNALELGVDIGRLDACVIAGYPGTIASTRQQAGRAGRRSGEAAIVLVAGAGPLDQYIVRHPEFLLGGAVERARLDADNLLVQLEHVRCAAFELPFGRDEAALPFGGHREDLDAGEPEPVPVASLLAVLADQGHVRHAASAWYWIGESEPAATVGLRSTGTDTVTIVKPDDGGEARGDVLGTVERFAAPSFVHQGAVYLHDGRAYEVVDLDWSAGRASVVPSDGATYTRASRRTDVRPVETAEARSTPGAEIAHGELEIRSRVTGYRRIRFRTNETVGWGDVDLPEQRHVAGGYWLCLTEAAVEALQHIGRWHHDPAADRGPSWPAQRERALARDDRRCRLCHAPERTGRSHDVHHVRPFQAFGYVAGNNRHDIAANALDNLITLCRACHRVAERALGLQGGLAGVGYAVRHIAPLYLMCDARDIEVVAEAHNPWAARPTVTVYERAAGGLGFGAVLFDAHEDVVNACRELVAACPCAGGCPACVGPVDERATDAKAQALAVLAVLADA